MMNFFHIAGGKVLATIATIILLFSGAGAHTAITTAPGSQAASVVVADTNQPAQTNWVDTATGSDISAPATTTTIINYIIQPVVSQPSSAVAPTAPVAPTASTGYVTEDELNSKISGISDEVGKALYGSTYPSPASTYNTGGIFNTISLLSTANNTVSNTTSSNINFSSLQASDIPALSYLALSGGSLTGSLGVNVLSPQSALDVLGFINTDGTTGGYKIDNNLILQASSTNFSTLVGIGAGSSLQPAGLHDTALGYQALNTIVSTSNDTAVGYLSLSKDIGSTGENTAVGALTLNNNTSGFRNVAIGFAALTNNTTGEGSIGIGRAALASNTTGSENISIGLSALGVNKTGSDNVTVGLQSMADNVTGSFNAVLGWNALFGNTAATNTVAVGVNSATGNFTAYSNQGGTYVGARAGYGAQTGSDYNTLIGYSAGNGITTGSNNIWLGTASSSQGVANITTGSQNIIIGNNISAPSAIQSGQLDIGNIIYGKGITGTGQTVSSGTIGVATSSPWRTLSVNGTVGFSGLTTDSADSKVLCLTANNEVVANAGTSCITSSQRFKNTIEPLATSSGLVEIMQLNPVSFLYNNDIGILGTQVGFIAEQVEQVDPRLVVLDASSTPFTVRYENLTAVLTKAIQEIATISGAFKDNLIAWLGSSTNGLGKISADQLCAKKSDGTDVCVTGDQLAAIAGGTSPQTSAASDTNSGTTTLDTEAPVITINGNNPAEITVGDTYSDLGASVTDNVDHNLGIKIFVGDTPIEFAVIDTSAPATYHINYVATDSAGNTATSTRTVIVQSPNSTATSTNDTATTTGAQ